MGDKEEVVVTIVNSNYPPSKGITGESAHELASFLVKKAVRVRVVHTNTDYLGGGVEKDPVGELVKIKALNWRQNRYSRMISSFLESYWLIRKASGYKNGPIIVMTDPQFLVFWASILLKRRKWFYWSMDIYPDAFVAGKLVSPNNIFYKIFSACIIKNPPSLLISLGNLQMEYLLAHYKKDIPGIILPCGIWENKNNDHLPDWRKTNKIVLGYCGNIGEAHSKEFLIQVINTFDTSKFLLILSLYGTKSDEVLNYARNKEGILIIESVPKKDLEFIDIHLVTLLPNWTHICVPSKAVSAICVGGAMLYCGPTDSDNWFLLNDAAWLIEDDDNIKATLINFFTNFSLEDLKQKKQKAQNIAGKLIQIKQRAFEQIYAESIK
jgi:hypothetical protein